MKKRRKGGERKWAASTGENEAGNIQREYFEDLYNIETQKKVAVPMCGFEGIRRGNYFGGEPNGRAEVQVREGKLTNGKGAGKDKITGEMIKGGGDRVVDWIWRAFESGVLPED